MRLPKSSTIHLFIFLMSVALLGIAFFMQYALALKPCILCISQRIIIAILGSLSMLVLLFKLQGTTTLRCYCTLQCIFSLFGGALSIRQLYLESMPSSAHATCLPGMEYLLNVLPWSQVLKMMLLGSVECGTIQWQFLGLTMAGWLLFVFVLFAILNIIEMVRQRS